MDLRTAKSMREATPSGCGPSWTVGGYDWTMIAVEFERVEALELLGMTLAHLSDAEARAEVSVRVPLLLAIRDKLAAALREEA